MKVSLNWLSDFVDIGDIPPEEVMLALTRSTCEVEGLEEVYAYLDQVIIARVIEKKKHPGADRLSLCKVDTGDGTRPIVCGAPNVDEGQLIALADIGCRLPKSGGKSGDGKSGDEEFLEIKVGKIRGETSKGMICSAGELGLEDILGESKGILVLNEALQDMVAEKDLKLGAPLSSVIPLHDHILEIDNKSITHRPDLWSHYGFARELSVIYKKKLKNNPLAEQAGPAKKGLRKSDVKIAQGAAKCYYGVHCSGARVMPSPPRIAARLWNIGQKPINNIVDASNYVMFETGQPNHIFDAANLKTDTIYVAATGKDLRLKSFKTLDEEERTLPEGTVMIVDGAGTKRTPIAIAGIMGGMESGVAAGTTDLFLESATFHRENIRAAISRIGLRTDSAQRFEKGQDPAKALAVLHRMVRVLRETCPDLQMGSVTGDAQENAVRNKIDLPADYLAARLGFDIKPTEVIRILEKLEFDVKLQERKKGDLFKITAPTFRSQYDVSISEDIVEEIGRIRGYENIAPVAPVFEAESTVFNENRLLERRLKYFLADAGCFSETNNYSFASEEDNLRFGNAGILLKNPGFADREYLRVSLVPGLLRQAAGNQDRFEDVRLFEFGRIYYHESGAPVKKGDTLPIEEKRLSMVQIPPGAKRAKGDADPLFHHFLEFRGLLERLFENLLPGIVEMREAAGGEGLHEPVYLHPGCAVEIFAGTAVLGYCGMVHPLWEKTMGLKRGAIVADVFFDQLFELHDVARLKSNYARPSIYPDSRFEVSLIMGDGESTAGPANIARGMNIPELREVEFLTAYRGEPLEDDQKSASFRFTFGRDDGTLSGERLTEIQDAIVDELGKAGWPLRT